MDKSTIKFVKGRLWSNGHKVKQVPEGVGYDLIVDGKYKVRVFDDSASCYAEQKKFDIYAIVDIDMVDGKNVFYRRDNLLSKRFKDVVKKKGGRHVK
jgi:hypothetical protein